MKILATLAVAFVVMLQGLCAVGAATSPCVEYRFPFVHEPDGWVSHGGERFNCWHGNVIGREVRR